MSSSAKQIETRTQISGIVNGREVSDIGTYGCHSDVCPDHLKHDTVTAANGETFPMRMSRTCMYDKITTDLRCFNCIHHE